MADDVLGDVGRHLRGPLRPGDPEHAVGEDRPAERLDVPGELLAGDREDQDDVGCRRIGDAAGAGRKLTEEGVRVVGPGDDRERAAFGDP